MPSKNNQRARFRIKPLCAALLFVFSTQSAQANPAEGAVVSGNASFSTSGNTLTVTNTPGTIINWQSFSIGASETTRFTQQSAASTVLNRVVTSNPSSILGTLSSNGRVFLVNPSGVIFGKGATVDVAGLVATTLNLSDADFLAGRYDFTQVPGAQNISNAGNITAQSGGEVYLIAPNVENSGVITAPNGEILLAAGHSVELVNSNDPNLRVSITAPAGDATNVGKLVAEAGSLGLFGTAVRNSGTVSADSAVMQGGKIVFKASQNVVLDTGSIVSGSIVSAQGGSVSITAAEAALNFSDIHADAGGSISIQADRILQSEAITASQGGSITLNAQNGIIQTGTATLDTSGAFGVGGTISINAGAGRLLSSAAINATGTDGGAISLTGNDIYLLNAQLDASGQQNGGTILVGGDAHGANSAVQNALSTYVNPTTTLKADGGSKGGSGKGGKIVVWSDQQTRFFGTLYARGGALGGNGGFAEVSGKNNLTFGGFANLSAPFGMDGNLLLDPKNITIAAGSGVSAFQLVDPHPGAGNGFGEDVFVLPNDNVVVAVPLDDLAAANAGAVYLFNGTTGALISTLTGSTANDSVGGSGVMLLSNGNYVVSSPYWDNGAVVDAGAATWGSGTAGVSGVISSANSLVGSTASDMVGWAGITALSNGSYVVLSRNWDNGAVADAGAVTWGNGTAGVSGVVSTANSLVGSTVNDWIGGWGDVTELANGNYVVRSPWWDNSAMADAGAVTWASGTAGITGVISSANSLVGSTANDRIGNLGIAVLSSGNYVVNSPLWDNGAVVDAGAVTWASGTAGVSGAVSAANSLVGSTASDQVGSSYITELLNGNYVVISPFWDNSTAAINAGAVTWGSGTAGVSGVITSANSLVGGTTNDQVGQGGVTALTNGSYVVSSFNWTRGGASPISSAGAVTWVNGVTGRVSDYAANGNQNIISAANSLVGSTVSDWVGGNGVFALTNGNYVVNSPAWDNGAVVDAGAVTWGDGATGTAGAVSAANSLVGSATSDQIGLGGIVPLFNGNYVVRSHYWDNAGVTDAGAVTWGSGTTGISGTVSSANSLVGGTAGDLIGWNGITVLPSSNYLVSSTQWDNGAVTNAGAVTWGSGTAGIAGTVSSANSLVGSSASDMVGDGGITLLTNANYVVRSTVWDNGAVADAGAVTWGSGATGVSGAISAANSLVGSTAGDSVGGMGVVALTNGNYVVRSNLWDNGAVVNAGAVTWGSGTAGVTGAVSAANSLVGSTANDWVGGEGGIIALSNGNYVVSSSNWDNGAIVNAGAVTWGNGTTGITGVISTANSLVGSTASDWYGSYCPEGCGSGVIELFNGTFMIRSPHWNNGALANAGRLDIVSPVATSPWLYADYIGQSITITPAVITAITNTGTAVTLEASNDITVNAAISTLNGALGDANTGGDINLHAGRSIFLNANITTDDGNLNLIANDSQLPGGLAVYRDAGVAQITVANGVTLDAGTGAINMQMQAGLAGGTGGDITWNGAVNATASSLTLQAVNNILFGTTGSITALTSPLNVVLNSDFDAQGGGAITMLSGSSISSGGGDIIMGGGANPATDYAVGSVDASSISNCTPGVCGIALLGAATSLNSGGGNISLRGMSFAGGNVAVYTGVWSDATISSGSGTITIDGVSQGSGWANSQGVILTGTLTSANTSASAITVTGSHAGTTNAQSVGLNTYGYNGSVYSSATIQTTNGGGINLTGIGGTSTNPANSLGMYLAGNVLSSGGEIRLAGQGTGGTINFGFASAVGGSSSGNILIQALGIGAIDDSASSGAINAGTSALTVVAAGGSANLVRPVTAGSLRLLGSGTFNISNAGNDVGTLAANLTGALSYTDANALTIGSVTSFDGTATTTTNGITASSSVTLGGAGTLTLNGASSWGGNTNFGVRPVTLNGTLSLAGTLTLNSGATLINNGTINAPSLYSYGLLGGSGSIIGDVFNDGVVAPGNSPGAMSITGNYTQGPAATFAVELGGTTAGSYDALSVSGIATLDGTLSVSMFGGYTGNVGDIFPVISASSISGTFATVSPPAGYTFGTNYLPSSFELALQQAGSAITAPVLNFIVFSSLPPVDEFIPPPDEEKKLGQVLAELTPAPAGTSAAPASMPVCQ